MTRKQIKEAMNKISHEKFNGKFTTKEDFEAILDLIQDKNNRKILLFRANNNTPSKLEQLNEFFQPKYNREIISMEMNELNTISVYYWGKEEK